MTDLSAVEISLEECRRYMARAERALESLKQGQDNNSYTAAMKRSSSDLSDALVVVRGNHKETKSKSLVKRNETVARNEIVEKVPFNPYIPRGIHPDDECILCPGCNMVYSNVHLSHDTDLCPDCRTTKFIASLPSRTCFKCGQKFNSENPCKWKGEIHCDDCFEVVSREEDERKRPGSEQNTHVQSQNPSENEQNAGSAEQRAPRWKQTPGSSSGKYRCLDDEFVELAYGSCSPIKTSWSEIWSLLDSRGSIAKEIESLLGDTISSNRVTAVRVFVKAVRAGKIPEAPEAV